MTKEELIEGIKAGRLGKNKTISDLIWLEGIANKQYDELYDSEIDSIRLSKRQFIRRFEFYGDLFQGADFSEIHFANCAFNSCFLEGSIFSKVAFWWSEIAHSSLENSCFEKCSFYSVDCSSSSRGLFKNVNFETSSFNAFFKESRIENSEFRLCKVNDFRDSVLSNVSFNYCSLVSSYSFLKNQDFYQATLSNVSFNNCDLRKVQITLAKLDDVKFINCDLRNADFTGTNLDKATFENCNTEGMKTGGGEEFYEVEQNFKQMLKDSED